jgi:hypothetical protein
MLNLIAKFAEDEWVNASQNLQLAFVRFLAQSKIYLTDSRIKAAIADVVLKGHLSDSEAYFGLLELASRDTSDRGVAVARKLLEKMRASLNRSFSLEKLDILASFFAVLARSATDDYPKKVFLEDVLKTRQTYSNWPKILMHRLSSWPAAASATGQLALRKSEDDATSSSHSLEFQKFKSLVMSAVVPLSQSERELA